MAVVILALFVGATLGLLGGGGSVLSVPLLVYVGGMPAQEAIAASLVVVGITSLAAVAPYLRRGLVDFKAAFSLGPASMLGAYAGGSLARYFSDAQLLVMFGTLMSLTALAMLRKRGSALGLGAPRARRPVVMAALGMGLGLVSGLLGAGGGFVLVPALYLLGGLAMRQAVATSLLLIGVNAWFGFLGHADHAELDASVTLVIAAGAALGALAASSIAHRVPQPFLRRAFGGLVLVIGVVILTQELPVLAALSKLRVLAHL